MKKGFTLIELMIVVGIIIIISTSVMISGGVLNQQLRFVSAYQGLEGILSEARSKALSGESFIDATDYDGDESFDDLILPNGYIVNFKTVDGIITVSLYADLLLKTSNIGALDLTDDQFIKSIDLHESIKMQVSSYDKGGGDTSISDENDFSLIYTTPNAAFQVLGEVNTSLQLKIGQVNADDDELRAKYLFIHYLFGIPELLNDEFRQA